MKLDDKTARPFVLWALEDALARPPTAAEVYALQCVTRGESYYGQGWRSPPHAPDMVTSLNMGAVQCTKHWNAHNVPPRPGPMPNLALHPVPSAVAGCCALVVDSKPGPDGKPLWYVGPYRTYVDPTEAFAHVARILKRMGVFEVANEHRTFTAVSTRMYDRVYYQGVRSKQLPDGRFAPDREANIADHVKMISTAARKIATANEEASGLGDRPAVARTIDVPPRPPALPGPPPVVSDAETLRAAIHGAIDIALGKK